VGPAEARKPFAAAVPRQLSYDNVDHKRISWLTASDSEDVNYNAITQNIFLVSMADIYD